MRGAIYNAIVERLKNVDNGAIKHVDLWNHNMDFLKQEIVWERPAVFIEFRVINWERAGGNNYRANSQFKLHVVTDWDNTQQGLEDLDMAEKIHDVLHGLKGEGFHGVDLAQSITNHNHEDIVENVEVYNYVAEKTIS